jgi:hypothetical protein
MDQESVSPEYLKRVNDGYLLAKHMPQLAAQLKDAVNDREDGFTAGVRQFEAEQEKGKEYLPSWLSKDRLDSLNREDQDKDIDKDDPLIE